MNILFGKPKWADWINAITKLPFDKHMLDFDNKDNIIKYIKDNNIDIIVPCTYEQMFFIINNKTELSQFAYSICNDNKNTIRMLDNKYYFYNYMRNNKLGDYIPKNYITNIDGNKVTHNKVQYPCIYKLQKTNGGKESFVIKSERDLRQISSDKNYIIQEYISCPIEYSAHFYVFNGIIKHTIVYVLENKEKNYIQCGRLQAYSKMDTISCLNIFGQIFAKLNYNGFACIDFKLINNIPKIFEINPRLGGTLLNDTDDLVTMLGKIEKPL